MQYKRDAANLSLELAAVRRQRAVSEWLSALGYDFMDENGDILPPVFASLEKVVQIEINRVPEC